MQFGFLSHLCLSSLIKLVRERSIVGDLFATNNHSIKTPYYVILYPRDSDSPPIIPKITLPREKENTNQNNPREIDLKTSVSLSSSPRTSTGPDWVSPFNRETMFEYIFSTLR
jgi:hypothetical protein